MKYPVGTILQWTSKALSPRREGSSQRHADDLMIVLTSYVVALVQSNGVIGQLDMFKSQDSLVTVSKTALPSVLKLDKQEADRCDEYLTILKLALPNQRIQITKKYEGRR